MCRHQIICSVATWFGDLIPPQAVCQANSSPIREGAVTILKLAVGQIRSRRTAFAAAAPLKVFMVPQLRATRQRL